MKIDRLFRRLSVPAWVGAVMLSVVAPFAHATLPIVQWIAPSGAKVLFVESHSIPILNISVEFDAGNRYDPPGKEGLADLTGHLLGSGALAAAGQPVLGEAQIADRLADVGAASGTNVGKDATSVMLRTLSSAPERQAALAIFAQLLQHPAFPEAVVKREKARFIANIAEADTKPEVIADKAFYRAMYGSHPYGARNTLQTVSTLTRHDLVAFYRKAYSARHAVVTLVGDIDRAQAEAIVAQLTDGLPAGAPMPPLPPVEKLTRAVQIDLPHPAEQAHILIGQPGIARADPDYFPILVGNYVLGGGGFVSRLTSEVREKRGLTYGVTSDFMTAWQPGPFGISLQTRRDQAPEALKVVRATLDQFFADGPTEAELQAAKDYLINSFPLHLDSNGKLLTNVAEIGFYNLPLDFLDTWADKVNAVTVDEVRQAFARHLQLDHMVTVVVGPSHVFGAASK